MVYFLIVKYYLIYWPDEDSVSAVPGVEVKEEVAVGGEYRLKNGRKDFYVGKVAAIGKLYCNIAHSVLFPLN